MSGISNTHADTTMKVPWYIKRPPFHPFRPRSNGKIKGVTSVVAFPFPTSRSTSPYQSVPGPYKVGASGWAETNPVYPHKDKMEAIMHMMGVALEMKNNGCPLFKEGRKLETMMAYVRHAEGRADIEDIELLNDRSACNQEHFTDLKVAEALRALLAGTFNEDIPGRQGNQHGDGEDREIQDGNNVNIRRGGSRMRRRRRPRQGEDEEEEAEDPMNETDAAIMKILKEALEVEEEDDEEEEDAAAVEGRAKKSYVSEKVKVLTVHMTRPVCEEYTVEQQHAGGRKETVTLLREKKAPDGSTLMEDAGFVVFMLMMDPFFSIGRSFRELIELSSEHRAMSRGNRDALEGGGGGGGGGGYDEDAMGGIGEAGGGGGPRGGGRGRGAPRKKTSRLLEAFPWLNDDEHAGNALLRLDMDTYIDTVAFYSDSPSLADGERRYENKHRGLDHPGTSDSPNPLHPLNVFTPERALAIMKMYGVKDDQCSMQRFRGANALFDNGDGGVGRTWRFPPVDTYHYPIEAWVWARPGVAGLSRQLWPWVVVPERLAKLARMDAPGQLVAYKHDLKSDLIGRNYAEARMRPDIGELTILPLIPYDPNKMLRQNTIWQMAQKHQRVLSDIVAPRDPENMPDEYSKYCFEVNEMRDTFFRLAQQAVTPNGAGLASSVKLIATFMMQEVEKVTTYLPMYTMDPLVEHPQVLEMDPFSNYMIREAVYLRNYLFVVGPSRQWQMAHYGSKDAYSMTNLKVHYASISRGISQSGKSWVSMSATIETSVPGTVQHMLESSNRSFNTHDDFTHAILFKDELEQIYVDSRAAEHDTSGRSERIKSMMTDQKATYQVLVFVDQANGRQRRVSEQIETLFHATMICCTNKRIDSTDEAIASRFLSFVITRGDVDIYEFLDIKTKTDDLDTQKKKDFVHMLRVKQCLIAMAQILIDVGALPEPSMDAYNILSTRMTAYFKQNGLEPDSYTRATQIIGRLARIYVILNAIINVFDAPGSLHYGAFFRLEMLMDLKPYLYSTKQITLFTLTQVGEIYYRPLQMLVLATLLKTADFNYERGRTVEQHVRADVNRQIRWRRDVGPNQTDMVDFNYIVIEGDFKSKIVKMVANNTQPRISENDVISEIKCLCDQKLKTHQLELRAAEQFFGMKQSEIATMALPRKSQAVQIPMVIQEYKANRLCIAVEAMDTFKEDMIIEAFLHCIHDGFRPQTFLLGINYSAPHPVQTAKREEHEKKRKEDCAKANRDYQPEDLPPIDNHIYTSVYKTLVVNEYAIRLYSMGPLFMEKDISYITPIVSEMIKGPRLHPDSNEDNQESAHKRKAPVVSFAEDIDDIAYRRHHYRVAVSGSHLDSPAMQPAIYARIRKHLREFENLIDYHEEINTPIAKRPRGTRAILLQYPEEYIADENDRLFREDKARPFEKLQTMRREIFLKQRANYNFMSDEDKKKHGMPSEIVASDFMCGGRFARADSSSLLALKEKLPLMQLEYKAIAEGRTLTEEERNAIRSAAVVPYIQTQNEVEKQAVARLEARRKRVRANRPDVAEPVEREMPNYTIALLAAVSHVPGSNGTVNKLNLAAPFQMAANVQKNAAAAAVDLDADASNAYQSPPPVQLQQQQQYQAPVKKNTVYSKSASLRVAEDFD